MPCYGASPILIIVDDLTTSTENHMKIEADTSKYTKPADRILAAAACIEAQKRGEKIQARFRDDALPTAWGPPTSSWEFSSLDTMDYRVRPAPVVTHKHVYKLRTNISPRYTPTDYESRGAALDAARGYSGAFAVDDVMVTYHDGVEVSRSVTKAVA